MACNAQFHYKIVHKLLRLALGKRAVFKVAFNINIKERAYSAERHCRAVLLFNCGKVGKISPLHRLARVGSGRAHIVAVGFRHFLNIGKRGYLV